MVEQIECLSPKLQVYALREVDVLEQTRIHAPPARSLHYIACSIATANLSTGYRRKCVDVEPMQPIVDRSTPSTVIRIGDLVRPSAGDTRTGYDANSTWIESGSRDVQGQTCIEVAQSRYLPSAEEMANNTVLFIEER